MKCNQIDSLVAKQSAFVSFELTPASDFFGKAKEIDPSCFGVGTCPRFFIIS